MPVGAIIGIIAAAVVLLIILANLKIVPQAAEYVIEFLGKYKAGRQAFISKCRFLNA